MGLRQGDGWSQDQFSSILCDLYRTQYRRLVGLAAILLDGAGEDAVQEAFVHVWSRWERIREPDKVLPYLRRAVVNIARSELRRRRVARRPPRLWWACAPANEDGGRAWCTRPLPTEDDALGRVRDETLIHRVRQLSPQQTACITLRFYLGLSEKETAEVLNIGTGSVKVHTSRAVKRLGGLLENNHE